VNVTKRFGGIVLTILAGMLIACSGGESASTAQGVTVKAVEPTPSPTATASPSPTPPAAVTPSPVGFSNPGTNSGITFPPPPPNPKAEPKDVLGLSRVVAPKLGVDHYIQQVGISNNEMEAPEDGVYAIGWYPQFGKPGHGGNIMITAHETWNHLQGPFYGLHKAKLGDVIEMHMADGTKLVYHVISNKRYKVDSIPMGEIIWPTIRPQNEEWLTLFTCGGEIVYGANGFGDYLDRDVVVARRMS
jgi:hypothetical protein